MANNNKVYINLPTELSGKYMKEEITNSFKVTALDVAFCSPENENIFINLNDIKTKKEPSLGYQKDQKGQTFFKDKQSLIYHFNKTLKSFALAPQAYIAIENVLGLKTQSERSPYLSSNKVINLYSEPYIEQYIDHPVNHRQIVSKANISDIVNCLHASKATKVILNGNLDYLVPYIYPQRHAVVEIFGSPNKLKHQLKTRRINNKYFLEIRIKDPTSSFFYDLFLLSIRKVLLDIEYEVPFNKKQAHKEIFNKADIIKSKLETYYELLMFGVKYSTYLFEDGYNSREEKLLFSHQDKINEICIMLNKLESQFFCFEITNKYLFTQLETMPPASLTDLALLQKEAFEETALIISAFFDLIKTLLKQKSKDNPINGN